MAAGSALAAPPASGKTPYERYGCRLVAVQPACGRADNRAALSGIAGAPVDRQRLGVAGRRVGGQADGPGPFRAASAGI